VLKGKDYVNFNDTFVTKCHVVSLFFIDLFVNNLACSLTKRISILILATYKYPIITVKNPDQQALDYVPKN
jgi:hypothetical protein